ncbi:MULTISPECIES: YqcC family protein [Pseudomonas]|uniref:YqcC family protein n=1 Tax=Pseudomonas donghuensis TaxID=1163398 RepID=A0AAP0SFR1_9PSED|nr:MULTISPECIES: YqcC family protein [Pseudomonas]MBS7597847.1 YqcC family protein [Pseudomonas sp. RC2C2]KDN97266.2 YqcC family protein [Pseudomonas donghuensis]MBF4208783.1 YqcC family protein [Pseudomonas donghuensis]MCP6692653.1 YqcC family protein [Pseudomonas donghuensis]MCP6699903.1 YqcC family protein [Pseudomonas donghuensis]
MMDPRILDIADHLLLIEHELRLQGWWSDEPPSAQALASTVPFAVDSMNFDQWLQWIFLPKMKVILEKGLPLPNASGILVMAETVYVDRPEQSRELRRLLAEFDQLISPSA